ncbi:MAG: transposase [Trichodesmium sp. MAG_R01]|nr:transposase [Trichodesmium sp. MAG_R01]
MKTVISRRLRKEFEEQTDNIYWKDVLGKGSYFIASCCRATIYTLKNYIEHQKNENNIINKWGVELHLLTVNLSHAIIFNLS